MIVVKPWPLLIRNNFALQINKISYLDFIYLFHVWLAISKNANYIIIFPTISSSFQFFFIILYFFYCVLYLTANLRLKAVEGKVGNKIVLRGSKCSEDKIRWAPLQISYSHRIPLCSDIRPNTYSSWAASGYGARIRTQTRPAPVRLCNDKIGLHLAQLDFLVTLSFLEVLFALQNYFM